VNGRQEERLENIERLLTDIRDVLLLLDGVRPPAVRPLPRQSGLNDLTRASNERSAELERDRREAERANGWAPDSELSWRDQFERLAGGVREYEKIVDDTYGAGSSEKLPWNRQRAEAPIERVHTFKDEKRPGPSDPAPRAWEERRRRAREGDVP
jgi:hypothetical protein